ncbi:FAD:protein FMN transferase, partial [Roseisalinus antarcticus]|uniref:FAD:protein FMN transferase n=1 Tax=Roseisalinus antarcticus TaxID=254357 RepID=UPI00117A5C63
MSKMSTERVRFALNGPTMGTRWSALFFAPSGFDPAPVQAALQAATGEVDAQMSTWNAGSDLMRLNAAPVGASVAVPDRLREVLGLALEIGRASGGAFD